MPQVTAQINALDSTYIAWFGGGAIYPAGYYTISYVTGAFWWDTTNPDTWGVGAYIVDTASSEELIASDPLFGFSSQAATETACVGLTAVFNHTAPGPIGVRCADDFTSDNGHGNPDPMFSIVAPPMVGEDLETIFTSADGTQRRPVPRININAPSIQIERYGGYGQGSVTLNWDYRKPCPVLPGDRMEVFYTGVRQYRGYVTERKFNGTNPRTVDITCFGAYIFLRKIPCTQNFAYPFNGADISVGFNDIAKKFALYKTGPQGVRWIYTVDAQVIGTTITSITGLGQTLGDVFDGIITQLGGLAIVGCDVDSLGRNRLYLRPLAALTPPSHMLPVPSGFVTVASAEEQSGDITNIIQVTGGAAQFPQLWHNGNFALPVNLEAGSGNLIGNPSFGQTGDNGYPWSTGSTVVDGASLAVEFQGQNYYQQPYVGPRFLLLQTQGGPDNSGATINQTLIGPVFTAGDTYMLSLYAMEAIDIPMGGPYLPSLAHATLVIKDSGGSTIQTVTLNFACISQQYAYFSTSFVCAVGAVAGTITITCDSLGSFDGQNNAICVGLISLQDTSIVYQDGWETWTGTNVTVNAINWVNPGGQGVSSYSVLSDVTITTPDTDGSDFEFIAATQPDAHALYNNPPNRISVNPGQQFRTSFWAMFPPNGAISTVFPDLMIDIRNFDSGGHCTGEVRKTFTGGAASGFANWTYFEFAPAGGGGPNASMWVRVIVRSTGACLLSNLSVMDINGQSMDPGTDNAPYTPEGNCTFLIRSDDSALTAIYGATPPYAGSIADYGEQSDLYSNDNILTLYEAQEVANSIFIAKALPYTRPPITIIGDSRYYWPGDSVSLQGTDGPTLSAIPLPIARITGTYKSDWQLTLSMQKEQQDPILVIKKIIQQNLQTYGASGSTNYGSAGGYSSNAGGAGGVGGGGVTGLNVIIVTHATSPYTVISNLGTILGCDTSGGAITIDLPAATGTGNVVWVVNHTSATATTITPNGSDEIDGLSTFVLNTVYGAIQLIDLTNGVWIIGCQNYGNVGANEVLRSGSGGLMSASAINGADLSSAIDNSTITIVGGVLVASGGGGGGGTNPLNSCFVATTAALPTNTYSNGASGVGATLTAIAVGVLTVDGQAIGLNQRLLVNNEATPANNGPYLCTLAGAIGVAYVLTRTTDCDSSAKYVGAYTAIEAGSTYADTIWICGNTTAPTVGTTAITFNLSNGGNGVSLVSSLPAASVGNYKNLYLKHNIGASDSLWMSVRDNSASYQMANILFGIYAPAPGFNPSTALSNTCELWMAADQITGLVNGDPVTSWTDGSANALVFTNGSSTSPTYYTNVYNGLPCIRNASLTDRLYVLATPGGITSSNGVTTFVVFKHNGVSGDYYQPFVIGSDGYSGNNGYSPYVHYPDINYTNLGAGTAGWSNAAPSAVGINLYIFTETTGGIASGYLNKVPLSGQSCGNMITPASITTLLGDNPSANASEIDLCEIIVYQGVVSSADTTTIVNYLNFKWGMPL